MESEKLLMTMDAARILNRSSESVRLYERSGKLQAAIKTRRGVRLYREADVRELARKLDRAAG